MTSSALGSVGIILKKISYGFALPGVIVTTALLVHLAVKYIFIDIYVELTTLPKIPLGTESLG